MTIKEKLKTACGKDIQVRDASRKHLMAHPDVLEFLEEAVSKTNIPEGAIYFEEAIDLGRTIGESKLIETEKITPDQKTTFALRTEKKFPSRVAVGAKGVPCDAVTVEIKFDERKKEYYLSTAYIGYPCPDEPFYIKDKSGGDFKKALDFWSTHALVFDPKIMSPVSEASWDEVLVTSKI